LKEITGEKIYITDITKNNGNNIKTYKQENRSAPPTSDRDFHRVLLTNRPENTDSHPIHGVKR
jgi:hypothetical protein